MDNFGAAGDQLRATASFLNPEPRTLSTESSYQKAVPAPAAAPADEAPPQESRFSRLDFRCAVE
jgi:hypothetical protein